MTDSKPVSSVSEDDAATENSQLLLGVAAVCGKISDKVQARKKLKIDLKKQKQSNCENRKHRTVSDNCSSKLNNNCSELEMKIISPTDVSDTNVICQRQDDILNICDNLSSSIENKGAALSTKHYKYKNFKHKFFGRPSIAGNDGAHETNIQNRKTKTKQAFDKRKAKERFKSMRYKKSGKDEKSLISSTVKEGAAKEKLNHKNEQKYERKFRARSFQLSSIRALSVRKLNYRSHDQENVEYGQRIILKDGTSNVDVMDLKRSVDIYRRYFSDLFTTLLDSSWTLVLLITTTVYIGHWAIFGCLYWFFALLNHDDIKEQRLKMDFRNDSTIVHKDPCVTHVYNGLSAFLFSLESETTIGYGFRAITSECPSAIVCLTLQCVISAIFDTWLIGMCFARLARPDARTKTTLFAKNAVVCKRDGKSCLLVRFANLRKSLLLNVTVNGLLVTWRGVGSKEKKTGLHRMMEQRQITFQNESSALLTAPIEYCHVIDNNSPLCDFRKEQFNSKDGRNYFELVCIITGTLESTGLTMQAQTSYLSSEILYGYRFAPVVLKCPIAEKYIVNFEDFHCTTAEPTFYPQMKLKPKVNRFQRKHEPLVEEEDIYDQNDMEKFKVNFSLLESVV